MEIASGKSKLNTTLQGGSSDEDDCKWHWFGTFFGAVAAVAVVAILRILVRIVAGGRSRATRAIEGVEGVLGVVLGALGALWGGFLRSWVVF